jgi:general secretion pathway protein G
MKNQKSKSAFSMIELIFVIVIIGILASVAIPRLAASRDDAEVTKARVVVASIRNALSMERQKRILRGEFNQITRIGDATNVFGNFWDANGDTNSSILEYPMESSTDSGHWSINAAFTEYTFNQNSLTNPIFVITNGRFVCHASSNCDALFD